MLYCLVSLADHQSFGAAAIIEGKWLGQATLMLENGDAISCFAVALSDFYFARGAS